MFCTKKITEDLIWVGVNDRRISLFENIYPIDKGVSYNSYLLKDEKNVLIDTVDKCAAVQFFENIEHSLDGESLDYLIINHMEPDHSATIEEVVRRFPDIKIICNSKIQTMLKQFFTFDFDSKIQIVKEGDIFNTGKHSLTFVMAPMVHWPEVMVTYDITEKILFSADAFGSFGALSGNIYADEVDFETEWLDEARRYYTNIVGKYGIQVQSLLKKAPEIKMICPLHGPVWRKNITWFIDKYQKWSSYTPEINSVLILSASVYGHTENAAEILASNLADKGIKNIKLLDVSKFHPSYIVSEAFKYSHIVFATSTYNAGIFTPMEIVLNDLKAHNLQNRTVAVIINGSWAPVQESVICNLLNSMKNMNVLNDVIKIASSLKEMEKIKQLSDIIAKSIPSEPLETNAMLKINYGLYLLSANENEKDNACVINAVNQISDKLIAISVNKANYTHDLILKNKKFAISVLTENTPFEIFEKFGYHSGKEFDKFKDVINIERCKNNLAYLPDYSNAVITATVVETQDCDTHTLFIGEINEAKVLSNAPSVTYDYYLKCIKPRTQIPDEKTVGFICKICGFIYEGEEIPNDYICPICKHGVQDFEKIQ